MAWLPRPVDIANKTISLVGLRVARNIPYGRHGRQKLDLYSPAARAAPLTLRSLPAEPLPVIVFFYGGSWQFGQRQDYRFAAASLARLGFIVAVPDYRLYPEVKYPAFVEDCAAATSWVFRNIASHGGDDGVVFLMGHSAGAYNAAMLALDPQYLGAFDIAPKRLAGWIGLAGPYDIAPFRSARLKEIFGGPEARTTQPTHHVQSGAPPALLLHGGRDNGVSPRNTAVLGARLREAGNAVETRIYPKLGHTGIVTALLPYLRWRTTVRQDLLHFTAACRNGEFADTGSDISAPMLR